MNSLEFRDRIKLHPRALVLHGRMKFRVKNKNKGGFPGLMPHYAMSECPMVQYLGANVVEEPNAAEIEFNLTETGFPLPSALVSFNQKEGNLVQLIYGQRGRGPTQAAYRVLREASAMFSQLGEQHEVFIASLPILTPDQYGINSGRHYLLGMWQTNGAPIFLNPDAVDGKMFQSPYPAEQKERMASNAPAAAAAAAWYETMVAALASTGLKGAKLHDTVLRARATQLVEKGTVASIEQGLAMARAEAPTIGQEASAGAGAAVATAGAASKAQTGAVAASESIRERGARMRKGR